MGLVAAVVRLLGQILIILLIIRALLTWIRPTGTSWYWGLSRFLDDVTDPFVAPIRRMMPNTGPFDFSIAVTIVVVYIVIGILGWIFTA